MVRYKLLRIYINNKRNCFDNITSPFFVSTSPLASGSSTSTFTRLTGGSSVSDIILQCYITKCTVFYRTLRYLFVWKRLLTNQHAAQLAALIFDISCQLACVRATAAQCVFKCEFSLVNFFHKTLCLMKYCIKRNNRTRGGLRNYPILIQKFKVNFY